jgi:transposase-like protein
LGKLTKLVFETGLEAELSEHLSYEPHEAVGRNSGNSRNGARSKTVITDTGPVELDVPRDRNGSFEPQLVRKLQRRLTGIDDMVCSLVAKGLTTGEVSAHLAQVYGADVSKDTISRITDRVLEGMSIAMKTSHAVKSSSGFHLRRDGVGEMQWLGCRAGGC